MQPGILLDQMEDQEETEEMGEAEVQSFIIKEIKAKYVINLIGCGGPGGDGGIINLITSEYDADLLMYLDKYYYNSGDGG